MKNSILKVLIMLLFFSSCSFNEKILRPYRIDSDRIRYLYLDPETGDSLIMNVGIDQKPVITNLHNDTVDPGYMLEGVSFNSNNGNRLYGWIMTPDSNFNGITVIGLVCQAGKWEIDPLWDVLRRLPFTERCRSMPGQDRRACG